MIYCSNRACAKPQNTSQASFCSHCGTPLQVAERFRLIQPLGASGQSFLAEDNHLPSRGRQVLVHLGPVAAEGGCWSSQTLQALEQLGQAGHLPQLLAVVPCPVAAGRPSSLERLLVHAWIDGPSLAQRLEAEGPMAEQVVQRYVRSLLEDLLQIHDRGFVHGDIRPQALVERAVDGRLLAVSYRAIAPVALAGAAERQLGQAQDLQRLHYWAPEQRLGQASPLSDLYSLGVTAIELLTGQPPANLFDVEEDDWCWETYLTQELTPGFKALLNGLLERAIRRRYGSALEALRDLGELDDLAQLANLAEPVEGQVMVSLDLAPVEPGIAQAGMAESGLAEFGMAESGMAESGCCLEQTLMMDTSSSLAEREQMSPREEAAVEAGAGEGSRSPAESAVPPAPGSPAPGSPAPVPAPPLPVEAEAEDAATLNLARPSVSAAEEVPGEGTTSAPRWASRTAFPSAAADDEMAFGLGAEEQTSPNLPGSVALPRPNAKPVRRSAEKGPTAWVAAVLENPLRLPLARLVQQLARGYAARGVTYVPWEIVQSLGSTERQPEQQAQFAATLIELGDFYRDQIRQGHRRLEHLVIAVAAYEQALRHLNGADERWAAICDDLGRIYLDLSRQHPAHRLACLDQAVATYGRGLGAEAGDQEQFLMLNNHLGEACGVLASLQEPEQNWRRAIAAYHAALLHCPESTPSGEGGEARLPQPQDALWGAIQNNLGTALWNLSQQLDSAESCDLLQRAIAAYNAALVYHDPDGDGVSYGMIQNNLGTAYFHLAQREKSIDLLRLAVGTYQVALLYRKRAEQPLAHAATQNNLGAASLQLADHAYADPQTQQEALEQSVIACDIALNLLRELASLGVTNFGFDPAATELNLGLGHQRLGEMTTGLENSNVIFAHLETALQCYLSLLDRLEPGHDIYELALEYLSQALHFLSENLGLGQDHPLLKQVPAYLFAEMSQQFQRQLQQVS